MSSDGSENRPAFPVASVLFSADCGCSDGAASVYLQTKLLASSVLPLPWYVATCGEGHSGRVRTTFPYSTRDAITSDGGRPCSTQRRMTPSISKVSVPGPPL